MKKGFTLIELLAVIVILAIIALIATPIILGIINDAREQSNERSKELYAKGLELAIAKKNLTDNFNPSSCHVKDGVAICDGEKIDVDVDNAGNINGTVTFVNGKIAENRLYIGEKEEETYAYLWWYEKPVPEEPAPEKPSGGSSGGGGGYGPSIDTNIYGPNIGDDASELETSLPSDKDAYLKFKLDSSNIVTNIYVCAKFSGVEHCVEGGPNFIYGNETTGSFKSLKNISKLSGTDCQFDLEVPELEGVLQSICMYDGVGLGISSDGYTAALGSNSTCEIYENGESDCIYYEAPPEDY